MPQTTLVKAKGALTSKGMWLALITFLLGGASMVMEQGLVPQEYLDELLMVVGALGGLVRWLTKRPVSMSSPIKGEMEKVEVE
jgi:hypothetical protein